MTEKKRNIVRATERKSTNNRARHLQVVYCSGLSPSSSLILQIHFLIHPHQQHWWSDKCIFQTFKSQQSFSLHLCPLSKGSRSIEVMKIPIRNRNEAEHCSVSSGAQCKGPCGKTNMYCYLFQWEISSSCVLGGGATASWLTVCIHTASERQSTIADTYYVVLRRCQNHISCPHVVERDGEVTGEQHLFCSGTGKVKIYQTH